MIEVSSAHAPFEDVDSWLRVGDPLADDVLSELRSQPRGLAAPVPAMRRLADAGNGPCRRFLEHAYAVPEWADFEAMREGAAMAARHALQFAFAHSHGVLFTTFSSPDSARILGRTGRFERSVPRRLAESATLFLRVVEADELPPGGEVWEVALRVRFLHAMVRQKIVRSGEWDRTDHVPINALHTAAGPLFFGTWVLRGLRALGARFTPEEAESYRLIWRYLTWVLGVPEALLGRTDAEQQAFDDVVEALAFAPDDTSRRLARACIEGLRFVRRMDLLPSEIHAALAERLLGRERAERMGIVATPAGHVQAAPLIAALSLQGLGQALPFAKDYSERVGRRFLKNTVEQDLAGAPAEYQMA